MKPIEDGSLAVGLFNRSEIELPVKVNWSDIGVTGPQHTRDLWGRQDMGVREDSITLPIGRHSVELMRLTPKGA